MHTHASPGLARACARNAKGTFTRTGESVYVCQGRERLPAVNDYGLYKTPLTLTFTSVASIPAWRLPAVFDNGVCKACHAYATYTQHTVASTLSAPRAVFMDPCKDRCTVKDARNERLAVRPF